jgi:ubiquinone/menaquinone biosynthesis C-methylase UbiE
MREIIEYYDRRSGEYDETISRAAGQPEVFPGARQEGKRVVSVLAELPAGRVLDVACGTGLFTWPLAGKVVALDWSFGMLRRTRIRVPNALLVRGDGTGLPFCEGAFERVVASHFYGHLLAEDRARFLTEARRVGSELVIVDSALHDGVDAEEWQKRVLLSGATYRIYKRHLAPEVLLSELGSGELLFSGRWFIVARSKSPT